MSFPKRSQRMSERLLRHFGGGATCTVRWYTETRNQSTGQVTRAVADTATGVLFVRHPLTHESFEGQRATDFLLMLDGAKLQGKPRLDGSCTVQFTGGRELDVVDPTAVNMPDGATLASGSVVVREGASAR